MIFYSRSYQEHDDLYVILPTVTQREDGIVAWTSRAEEEGEEQRDALP